MSLSHLAGYELPTWHPLAGREAFQCAVCQGISYPPDPKKGCPYCNDEEQEDTDEPVA